MRTGKTRRGVELGGTFGMPSRHRHATWVVVMDRSRAWFFENARAGDVAAGPIHQIANPEGRIRGKETITDRPGRSFDSFPRGQHGQAGGARHAHSSAVSPHDEAAHKLVTKVVDYLEEGRGQNRYEHLILIAETHFLGLLRGALGSQVSSKILKEIEQGWVHLSGTELAQKISTVLSSQETMGEEEKAV